MPELPEVETIARSLRNSRDLRYSSDASLAQRPGVVGRVISSVQVLWERTIAEPTVESFCDSLSDKTITAVERRGKFLIFRLEHGCLLLHLRMSGDVRVEPQQSTLIQKHDRMLLNFKDGMRLVFNDTRKFGRAWFARDDRVILGKLGPDPFESALTSELWQNLLRSHKRQIKPLLMDQAFLAGLGNIYTDEALHRAHIHPLRISDELDGGETNQLLNAIRDVLQAGIERNGASIDWVYRGGKFQNYFQVYQRDGEPCYTCGATIARIVVGQRGTHFCPVCQTFSRMDPEDQIR